LKVLLLTLNQTN